MKSNFLNISFFAALFLSAANASYTTPTDAYKAAIENSTKVNSSKFSYESKEEGINEIYAKLYPQLEGNLSYSKTDYERKDMVGRNDNPNVRETSKDISLVLNQVIYNPSLMSNIDVEKTRVKLSSYDHELQKQKIASEALDTYMSVLNIKNKVSLLKANLEYVAQNQKMIEEKFSMGLVTKMDYLKVQVEYQKSKIDLIKEEKNYEIMYAKLKDITKLENISVPDINFESLSEDYVGNVLKILDEYNSLDKNLNILQAKTSILMSSYEIDNARDGHLPDLSLNASYTKYVSKDETADYNNYGRAMIKLRVPIFEGGAVSSRVTSKQLMKRSSEEEYRTVEDDVRVKLNENVNSLRSEIETLNMYKTALVSGETYLKSVQQAYDKGLKSIVELYDAKNKLFEIKYDYIRSVHEMSNLFVAFLITTNNLDKLDLIDNLVHKEEMK